ncbi:hypothetical protein AVEN_143231-1 [Araneus ventricosus]|uniref:Uncharacterized protein n=1 Tax=Araneus ventricosus TaxID=182803 RepID=A0A4Y2AF89_ARAVE|nr:hypothetical protein AVEN_143231-1 [Araneus ventricosus]
MYTHSGVNGFNCSQSPPIAAEGKRWPAGLRMSRGAALRADRPPHCSLPRRRPKFMILARSTCAFQSGRSFFDQLFSIIHKRLTTARPAGGKIHFQSKHAELLLKRGGSFETGNFDKGLIYEVYSFPLEYFIPLFEMVV